MITETEYQLLQQKIDKHHADLIEAQTKMAEAVTNFTNPRILPDDVVWLQIFCALGNRPNADGDDATSWADYGLAEYTKRFKDPK